MQTISNEQFLSEIAPLIEAFPSLKNRAKLERIYFFLSGLPFEAARTVILQVGDHAKSTPTPNEFRELAVRWKNSYYAKHGNYYGVEKIENQEITFCEVCKDAGIIELIPHGKTEISHHMRCYCEFGLKHFARLPVFDKGLKQGFRTNAPALENFKPTKGELNEIWTKFGIWKGLLEKSEIHWKNLGYKHKESL